MNTKQIIATMAIAFASAGAFAAEATEFKDMPSTQSRAAVKAELARAKAAGELNRPSSLYGYFEPVTASVRSREEVRAEAVRAAHDHSINGLYVGS